MGDADRRLHDALSEVQDLLETAHELEEQDRADLRSTMREIQEALKDDSGDSDSGSIVSGLRAAVDRFEESHPRLTEVIGRVADALADLGI
jgi:hypothetical protein